MNIDYRQISETLNISPKQIEAVHSLLLDGATVPFIARYRKEATGSLDEVSILSVRDEIDIFSVREKRRDFVLKKLTDLEVLDGEFEKKIRSARTLDEIEDIYLPFKPRRKTRAAKAREMGLEPLADVILKQGNDDIVKIAEKYINTDLGVFSIDEAIQGASDIIAETINEDPAVRERVREEFNRGASFKSSLIKKKEDEAGKFRDYFDWSENASKAPSHRILAMFRGAAEGYLRLEVAPDDERSIGIIEKVYLKKNSRSADIMKSAIEDSYKRLLKSSMENELKSRLREKADMEAIRVFSENLRELLLAPPLGEMAVLALDPGLRTGCKVAVLSSSGDLLDDTAVYPLEPHKKTEEAKKTILSLCEKYKVKAIAVGNGTGGKEALSFCNSINDMGLIVVMVNESGASIYSASETARKEFPDKDVTVRGAVSIGRRLMDPLSELVKIDPKSIGVGQYQHDVDQKKLKSALDDVVVSCVNSVGVDLNTASAELLKYVSGLSEKLAVEIVKYRSDSGKITSRKDIMKISGMGRKAFEQCAGFLRIRDGKNPLDSSAVHPESYSIVKTMSADLGCKLEELIGNVELVKKIKPEKYADGNKGLPTLLDIVSELEKPGRDPRDDFEYVNFSDKINEITDLEEGMVLPGVVTNVTAFGAFIDIGVHQDGLVHISEMADKFVDDPHSIVSVGRKVTVKVLQVDCERRRISLSMKGAG